MIRGGLSKEANIGDLNDKKSLYRYVGRMMQVEGGTNYKAILWE